MATILKPPANALAPDMALSHLLNFSRGIAALLVLFFHIRTTLVVPYKSLEAHNGLARVVFAVSTFGHDAVVVFFVLSGYLVGGAVLKDRYGVLAQPLGIRHRPRCQDRTHSYCGERFSIFLQHMMALSACADNAVTILGNALALQNVLVTPLCNNLPLWSISNEVVYYFVFPVIVAVVARILNPVGDLAGVRGGDAISRPSHGDAGHRLSSQISNAAAVEFRSR